MMTDFVHMPDVPFSGSIPIYVALGLLTFSLLSFLVFVSRRVHRLVRRLRRQEVEGVGIVASTFRLLLLLLSIAVSAAVLFLFAFIQSYTSFTRRELAATVRCEPLAGAADEMLLEITTDGTSTDGGLQRFRLRGQQWAVEGNILKWDDWLNFVGVHTMYKLTRVRGRYLRAEDEVARPATAYSLVADQEDRTWHWLYEYGTRLPFVQAVYGNTVYTFPSERKTYRVYVTTSGFMLEEQGQQ